MSDNIYKNIPQDLPEELFETIILNKNIKIEKIVSQGHTSPPQGWYDQEENEWILLLEGEAQIEFEEKIVKLSKGDYINIPSGKKHKVIYTKPDKKTIWLAIFYP